MASIRLTKEIKKEVSRGVVMDLFVPALSEKWKLVQEQFSSLIEGRFKDFDWEHVEPYREFIRWDNTVIISGLPGDWRQQNGEFRRSFNTPDIKYIDLTFTYPSEGAGCLYLDYSNKDVQKQIHDILHPYAVDVITALRYYTELQQVLLGVSTYKQLEVVIPECLKYTPYRVFGPGTALVPIEQINRVRSMFQKKKED